MATKNSGTPWMPADDYGRGLKGLGVNLLVSDMGAAVEFAQTVLGAESVYADPDFAVLRYGQAEWMLHADHTYEDHPLHGFVAALEGRGAGAELRLHDCDPDKAEAAARRPYGTGRRRRQTPRPARGLYPGPRRLLLGSGCPAERLTAATRYAMTPSNGQRGSFHA